MSKIRDWKQITTMNIGSISGMKLFPVCQRSEIESKSQRKEIRPNSQLCCFRYVKDQRLKANHNLVEHAPQNGVAVSGMSKIRDWKQITTADSKIWRAKLLFPVCQRSEIESKSQPTANGWMTTTRCFRYVKDQRLKANHNLRWCKVFLACAVSDRSKIKFWKQITTS